MTWRSLSLVVLLAPLALTGCPPESPDDSDTDTSDVDPGTDDPDTTDPDTEDPDTEAAINCHALDPNLAPFAGDIPVDLVTETAPATDAGLGAIIDAAGSDAADVSMAVNGAVVTTMDYNAEYADTGMAHRFFIEDASGSVYVRTDFEVGDGWAVAPGDVINFTATNIQNYSGVVQIGALENLTVVSSSNPVHVIEANGQTLDVANDTNTVHHLYGELVSVPVACGSYECIDLETRDDAGNSYTTTFRIRNDRLGDTPYIEGDCVELYAPLGQFSGSDQFNILNFSWVRWLANVND